MTNSTQLVYCATEPPTGRGGDDIARVEAIKSIKNKWLRLGAIILEVFRKACSLSTRW